MKYAVVAASLFAAVFAQGPAYGNPQSSPGTSDPAWPVTFVTVTVTSCSDAYPGCSTAYTPTEPAYTPQSIPPYNTGYTPSGGAPSYPTGGWGAPSYPTNTVSLAIPRRASKVRKLTTLSALHPGHLSHLGRSSVPDHQPHRLLVHPGHHPVQPGLQHLGHHSLRHLGHRSFRHHPVRQLDQDPHAARLLFLHLDSSHRCRREGAGRRPPHGRRRARRPLLVKSSSPQSSTAPGPLSAAAAARRVF